MRVTLSALFFLSSCASESCKARSNSSSAPNSLTSYEDSYVGPKRLVLVGKELKAGWCWRFGEVDAELVQMLVSSTAQQAVDAFAKPLTKLNSIQLNFSDHSEGIRKSSHWKGFARISQKDSVFGGIEIPGLGCTRVLSEHWKDLATKYKACTFFAATLEKDSAQLVDASFGSTETFDTMPTEMKWDLIIDLQNSIKNARERTGTACPD